jgi:hypothetical protein
VHNLLQRHEAHQEVLDCLREIERHVGGVQDDARLDLPGLPVMVIRLPAVDRFR